MGGDFIKIIIGTNQSFFFEEKNEEKDLSNKKDIGINEEEQEEKNQLKKSLDIKKKNCKYFKVVNYEKIKEKKYNENNKININNKEEHIKLNNINIKNENVYNNNIKNTIENIKEEKNNLNEKNNEENTKEENEIKLNENFINEGKKFIKQCLSKSKLKDEEIIELKSIYSEIRKLDFDKIKVKEEKKLNLVIDLDKTLIYVTQIEKGEKFKEKKGVINCEFLNENLSCSFRKSSEKFFSLLKNIYKFYIYTTSTKEYAKNFSNIIEKRYEIKFENILSKLSINIKGMKKRLSNIQLSKNNSIIFDDKIDVWEDDFENVIVSKRFLDDFMVKGKKFSDDFEGICYNKIKNFSQYKSNISYNENCCKISNENNIPLNVELNNEKQFNQLDYLIPFYQLIFVLYNIFNINVVDSIKLIRCTIFYKCLFDISNSDLSEKNHLNNMIYTLGGEICDYNSTSNATHIVINKKKIINQKKSIDDLYKKYNDKAKFVNIKYIFDSFFFYNKMDENDPEYKISN